MADITTWDGKVQTQRLSPVAFILPHEIIFKLLKKRCGLKQRAPHRVPKIMWPKPVNASKVLSFHWGCGQMQPDELGLQ